MRAALDRSDGARLDRLRARFEVETLKLSSGEISSMTDAITRGRVRYLQMLVHRLCEETGEPVPEWANGSPLA
jgi:hypothetical protein